MMKEEERLIHHDLTFWPWNRQQQDYIKAVSGVRDFGKVLRLNGGRVVVKWPRKEGARTHFAWHLDNRTHENFKKTS